MNNKKLLTLYGLKWNPFHSDIPVDGLYQNPKIESFLWRVENLVMDGGIALITGDPGVGKSTVLRLLYSRLSDIRDVTVATLSRPQSNLADFYREMGECFGVELRASNRWGGYKALRSQWRQHIDTTLMRPVLLIDEAQEMLQNVLAELRLLSSDKFDSRKILTIILSGDKRLGDKLHHPELLPLLSRIRSKLSIEPLEKRELMDMISHITDAAGNKLLITPELQETLSEHALGNPRAMMHMADEILTKGALDEKSKLDEKLFFELMEGRLAKRGNQKGGRHGTARH